MASIEKEWQDNFHGPAVYPLDRHVLSLNLWPKKNSLKSLVHICAAYIVKDSSLTLATVAIMPQSLYPVLMHEALVGNKDRAVEVILSHWPLKTMTLSELAPPVFTSLLHIYHPCHTDNLIKQCLRYTTCMAHSFIESLRKRTPTNLRYLDLSGYPTAELIVHFIASHVLLAFTETQQSVRIKLLNSYMVNGGYKDQSLVEEEQSILPDNCSILIKVDAYVSSSTSHGQLCKALKVSAFPDNRVRLCVVTLGCTCVGEPSIIVLLEVINPQYLEGLQLKYNSLSFEDIIHLSPSLNSFVNLTSLDLSCNGIYFYRSDASCEKLSDAFACMPNLARLDFSNNRLSTKLQSLLSRIIKPLVYLGAVCCSLTVSDISYLTRSHHVTGLRELHLCSNPLGRACHNLAELLVAMANNLLVFEAEDCGLNSEHFEFLLPSLAKLNSLVCVNFAENRHRDWSLINLTHVFARLPKLRAFRLSYPLECYSNDDAVEDIDLRVSIVARLQGIVSKAWEDRADNENADIMKLIFVEYDRIPFDDL